MGKGVGMRKGIERRISIEKVQLLQEAVIDYIGTHCRGFKNRIVSKDLIRALDINWLNGLSTSDKRLREAISDAVIFRRIPIGSSIDGFWWMITQEDYQIAVDYLLKKEQTIKRRRKALKKAFEARER